MIAGETKCGLFDGDCIFMTNGYKVVTLQCRGASIDVFSVDLWLLQFFGSYTALEANFINTRNRVLVLP